jgi:hypothetical protein
VSTRQCHQGRAQYCQWPGGRAAAGATSRAGTVTTVAASSLSLSLRLTFRTEPGRFCSTGKLGSCFNH